ncbi:MAG: ribonuclease P protein component [Candidatus Omnitrophota bacterium]
MKIERIRKTADFQDVLKNGKKVHGGKFSLYTKRDKSIKTAKAGVVIPKRFAPKAAQRNYIRRVINATFREHSASLDRGILVVTRLSREVRDIKKRNLSKIIKEEIRKLFKKSGIIK